MYQYCSIVYDKNMWFLKYISYACEQCLIGQLGKCLWQHIEFGEGVQSREDSSEERNRFNPEEHVGLGCRTPKRFTLGKAVKDGKNYEDNIGNTPMGANGLQEIEDLNNEGRNKQVSSGVRIVLDGSCKQLTMAE